MLCYFSGNYRLLGGRIALLLWGGLLVGGRLAAQPDPAAIRHIDSLNAQARVWFTDSLAWAEALSREALAAAQAQGYRKGMVHALRFQGVAAYLQGDLAQAIAHYETAMHLVRGQAGWQHEYAALLLNMGNVHHRAGNLGQALASYLEAAPLYARLEAAAGEHAMLLNNLAAVYRQLHNYEEALRIYEQSLALKTRLADTIGMANTYTNMGLVYGYLQAGEQAVTYLLTAKRLFEAAGQLAEAQSVNIALGDALHELGRRAEARAVLEEWLAQGHSATPVYEALTAQLTLANLYLEEGQAAQAATLLAAVEPVLAPTAFHKLKATFHKMQAYAAHDLGQPEAAYASLLAHTAYLDTLQSAERLKLEKDMEAKYLTKEKENLIQIQDLQLQKNQRERLALLGLLLALLFILALGYYLLRVRQRAHALLQDKNATIEKALGEKELLLREIHHRVKNNLQIISSLLSLQSRQIHDPKALEALQEGRNRVNSMALIHKNLYQEGDLVGVDAKAYIDMLVDHLMQSYPLPQQQVAVAKDIAPLKLDVDTIIPLGLILNELISNALKYAFGEERAGKLYVGLQAEGDGLRLRIADNGPGLPPGFDLDHLQSLGFRLVKAFAQKLKAQLHLASEGGTTVQLFIPHKPPTAWTPSES